MNTKLETIEIFNEAQTTAHRLACLVNTRPEVIPGLKSLLEITGKHTKRKVQKKDLIKYIINTVEKYLKHKK